MCVSSTEAMRARTATREKARAAGASFGRRDAPRLPPSPFNARESFVIATLGCPGTTVSEGVGSVGKEAVADLSAA